MRKKAIFATLLMCVMLAAPSVTGSTNQTVYAQTNVKVQINGVPLSLSTPAFVDKKTVIVPLCEVADALKAQVSPKLNSGQPKTVTLSRGNRTATLTIGSTLLTANGRSVKLDVAPSLRGKMIMVPLRAISESLGTVVAWDGFRKIISINDPTQLPVVGTTKKLEQLLKQIESSNGYFRRGGVVAEAAQGSTTTIDKAAVPTASSAPSAGESNGFSQTNVQVEGVDEADWAKTDGKFIYQLSGSRILISDISNPSAPKLASTLEYMPGEMFNPQELYVDNKKLIVIGQNNSAIPMPVNFMEGGAAPQTSISSDAKMGIMPPRDFRSTVLTKIYELSDSGQPKLIRETQLEGTYISSRKIDSALYVITNKNNYMYYPMTKSTTGTGNSSPSSEFEPLYGDSSKSSDLKKLPLSDIRYFPDSSDNSILIIGVLDLDRPAQEMQVSAYLGSGQTIYASAKHLYVAIAKYIPKGDTYRQETQVYKFRLDQGNIVYIGEGSVPGTVLNQFAMDEHDSYFRIATTTGDTWASGEGKSSNNLYMLDEQMKTVGTLANLAPGERIYSTRFMGGRAYIVTFRNVDPLFAIDLRNPAKPTVLGQLKIPGYSDYLHPYDDNHLIGFGKETIEIPSKGSGPDATMAFYQGMKIALFDVSDVSHPIEKFKETIGDRGTNSELLSNHKALLFSKSKGLMAFPVELMEVKNKGTIEQGGFPEYGQFTYQGAYVYHVDLDKGFTLQGRITHLSQDDLIKSGQYGFDYGKSVRRILYAGDTLYTLSDRMLKANDMSSLKERGELTYPAPPEPTYQVEPGGPSITPIPAR
ncbi:beta-propeller domain-containing protein [Cohnella silvisoli]|uniref:Beta-propeller domain-containing protein n=1 Tax=Cohnella silvisoli TaxID=2873699 RepID=A0ABV1L0M8_9BACL|nr:beta-propeller domain-containing protein [Cohnella silvisoli]MCD9024962.1 beta-propeller domain-containing protein [Cohnella silvisoli]